MVVVFVVVAVVVVVRRLGLARKGAIQLVTWSLSSIDGAKPDQQHDATYGLSVEHMIRKCIVLTV